MATTRVFTASRFTSGNMIFPTRIEISKESVARIKPKLVGSTEDSIPIVKIASVSISSTTTPRYSTRRRGTISRPSSSPAVSGRPCVSTNPTTRSVPRLVRRCASSSMRYVFPTPGAMPR
jgi:hypothetical protein